MRGNPLQRFAVATLGWNVLVILWGAYVRATGSGAGCGSHWPLCNGEVLPREATTATLIELTHRLTSGVALLLVGILAVWAFRARDAGHPLRKAAAWSVALILVEAAVGAGLVLFELVGEDASLTRAAYMAVHLVNTFLLLAALTLTAWWAGEAPPSRWRAADRRTLTYLAAAAVGLLLVGASGAVAALGDTLFPATTVGEAVRQDLSLGGHLLLRLRLVHPLLAVTVAVLLLSLPRLTPRPPRRVRRLGSWMALLVLAQLALGAVNVALLAPVTVQLLHLLLADAVWIALVLYGAALLAEVPQAVPAAVPRQSTIHQGLDQAAPPSSCTTRT
ncbi:MAG TPA: COX15/CtaA family protein [Thermoanaerobaculia bacterium]|nr:COX15/CtaA family protein [Thermoanaerobaculia bacterium]